MGDKVKKTVSDKKEYVELTSNYITNNNGHKEISATKICINNISNLIKKLHCK